jgi:hypothetical protein
VKALGIEVEQTHFEAQRVAQLHFMHVGQMRLQRKRRAAVLLSDLIVQSDELKERTQRSIEHHVVIAHIHVAVVIDPFGFDDGAAATERCIDS